MRSGEIKPAELYLARRELSNLPLTAAHTKNVTRKNTERQMSVRGPWRGGVADEDNESANMWTQGGLPPRDEHVCVQAWTR